MKLYPDLCIHPRECVKVLRRYQNDQNTIHLLDCECQLCGHSWTTYEGAGGEDV